MRKLDLNEVTMVSGGCDEPGVDCPSGGPWDDNYGWAGGDDPGDNDTVPESEEPENQYPDGSYIEP